MRLPTLNPKLIKKRQLRPKKLLIDLFKTCKQIC